MSKPCPAVFEPYPKSLTYYLVNDTPRGVDDMYSTRVHVSNTRTLHKVVVSMLQSWKLSLAKAIVLFWELGLRHLCVAPKTHAMRLPYLPSESIEKKKENVKENNLKGKKCEGK